MIASLVIPMAEAEVGQADSTPIVAPGSSDSVSQRTESIYHMEQVLGKATLFLFSDYSSDEIADFLLRFQTKLTSSLTDFYEAYYTRCNNGTKPFMRANRSIEIYLFKAQDKNQFYKNFLKLPSNPISAGFARVLGIPTYLKSIYRVNKELIKENDNDVGVALVTTFIVAPAFGVALVDDEVMRTFFNQPLSRMTQAIRAIDKEGVYAGPFVGIDYSDESEFVVQRYPIFANTSVQGSMEYGLVQLPLESLFGCR